MSSHEHLNVLIVGAGLSGIDAAYRIQSGSPDRRWAIFEARGAVGGTWDLFRYPGVRSDSDMATLGFPFRPWREEKSIADGDDIRAYISDTAREFGIDRKIRLRHRVVGAAWSSIDARWTIDYLDDGLRKSVTCDFLFMCSGYYDYEAGHAPTWPRMDAYRGSLVHPQFWPDDLDAAGKSILVIGSGATAVTLVPALAAAGAAHVTMLQRSPTYIAPLPSRDPHAARFRKYMPRRAADAAIRWKNIAYGIATYNLARKRPQLLKRRIADAQRELLGPDFEMAGHFAPAYEPWDQRLCIVPDGDLFETLRSGGSSIITDQIVHFTEDGVRLASGREIKADVVVTATGLRLKLMGGAALSVDGETVSPGSRLLYKGAMLEGVPNFAVGLGYTNASWTLRVDLTSRFVSRLLNFMARRNFAVVTPRADADARGHEPVVDLKSGYIQRSAELLPRQGRVDPWRIHQNYVRDLVAYRLGRLNDGTLLFKRRSSNRTGAEA